MSVVYEKCRALLSVVLVTVSFMFSEKCGAESEEYLMIVCMSERVGSPITGYDYECQYEHGDINCSDCILCGGKIDPRTGKRANKSLLKEVRRIEREILKKRREKIVIGDKEYNIDKNSNRSIE